MYQICFTKLIYVDMHFKDLSQVDRVKYILLACLEVETKMISSLLAKLLEVLNYKGLRGYI